MRLHHLTLTAAGLLFASAAIAAPLSRDSLVLQPQSRLWIEGTSTTKDFSCKASVLDVRAESAVPGAASAIANGEKAITSVALEVPASRLDCNNGTMNNHMWKALKVEEHPTISFALRSYELNRDARGATASMSGSLTIGGVTKAITMDALTVDEGNGLLRVTGSYTLNMKEYGIKPPSLMLGTMKVGERVKVNFDLLLKG